MPRIPGAANLNAVLMRLPALKVKTFIPHPSLKTISIQFSYCLSNWMLVSTSFHGFSQPSFSALSFECSLSSSFYSTWAFFTSPCNFLCTSPVEAFATSSCMPCSFVVQANLLWGNYSSNSIYLENMNSKVVIAPRPHFLIPYSSREEPAMFLCNVLCCILKSFFEPVLVSVL